MAIMKDSGVKWIGDIPEDWDVIKLKYILENKKNAVKVGPFGSQLSGSDILSEGDYWVYNQRTVLDNNYETSNTFVSEEKYKDLVSFTVSAGDILITTRGSIGKISRVPNEHCAGVIHPCIIKFNIDDKKYLYSMLEYIFNQSDLVINQVQYNSNSTTIDVIYSDTLKNIELPYMPLEQQEKIVSFLKEKIGEIDSVIDKTKVTIDEYKQFKRSSINEVVKRGLREDVLLKDSGVEWIGNIPEHWKIRRGKTILTLLDRPVLETDDVITCFRDGQVTLRKNRRTEGFTVSLKEIGYQGIEPEDLVVHGMDGFAGAIGISDSRGKASPVLNVCDSSQNKKYIMYYLRSMAYDNVFTALATGIRVRSCDLRWNKLAELDYPVPPLEEQEDITEYLDAKCAEIDKLISSKEALIEELEAYKKTVIYEYVTGKKEVL